MSTAEAIDKILSRLGTLLRYIAPGFVFLMFARIANYEWYLQFDKKDKLLIWICCGI